MPSTMTRQELLDRLAPWGQAHVLAYWEYLDAAGKRRLAEQIAEVDLSLIHRLFGQLDQQPDARALAQRARPPRAIRLADRQTTAARPSGENPASSPRAATVAPTPEADPGPAPEAPAVPSPADARAAGEAALCAGRVGALLVAGGQGTRLGFDRPKGMYPIGPVSRRSLFQIHVETLLARARRHGAAVPLYVMTSPATHEATVDFFARHDRFGLAAEDLRFFCQGTMPAVEAESGKLVLAEPDALALSPDGHGGVVAALGRAGLLDEMARRGIELLFYFQVDNPLVAVADPEFLGYHLLARSEMTTQVIAKRDPLEKVGNAVEIDERLTIIEYSDLPEEVARARSPDGSLRIWAGSIGVHAIDVAFLRRMADRADALPFHAARKRVECVDASGTRFPPPRINPTEPNAIKFERFVFDLIPQAAGALVVEIDPAEGFAPLKDAPGRGDNTPEAVRQAMIARHHRWLRGAGVELSDDAVVEISPFWALEPGDVAARVRSGLRVEGPTFLVD